MLWLIGVFAVLFFAALIYVYAKDDPEALIVLVPYALLVLSVIFVGIAALYAVF